MFRATLFNLAKSSPKCRPSSPSSSTIILSSTSSSSSSSSSSPRKISQNFQHTTSTNVFLTAASQFTPYRLNHPPLLISPSSIKPNSRSQTKQPPAPPPPPPQPIHPQEKHIPKPYTQYKNEVAYISPASLNYLPPPAEWDINEILFLGRSNVGKSELMKAVLLTLQGRSSLKPVKSEDMKYLPRSGKKAGKTKSVNYYGVWGSEYVTENKVQSKGGGKQHTETTYALNPKDATGYLVDLPGYGYAQTVGKSKRTEWMKTTVDFLEGRIGGGRVFNLFLLIDSRRVYELSCIREKKLQAGARARVRGVDEEIEVGAFGSSEGDDDDDDDMSPMPSSVNVTPDGETLPPALDQAQSNSADYTPSPTLTATNPTSLPDIDMEVIQYLQSTRTPFSLVLTKLDLIPTSQRIRVFNEVTNDVNYCNSQDYSNGKGIGMFKGSCCGVVLGTTSKKVGGGVEELVEVIVRGMKDKYKGAVKSG